MLGSNTCIQMLENFQGYFPRKLLFQQSLLLPRICFSKITCILFKYDFLNMFSIWEEVEFDVKVVNNNCLPSRRKTIETGLFCNFFLISKSINLSSTSVYPKSTKIDKKIPTKSTTQYVNRSFSKCKYEISLVKICQ